MITLGDIAFARSGDKGANSNIGVIAYTLEGYQFLKEQLKAEYVQAYFCNLAIQSTVRYELPNLWALNFVLKGALGEGGSRSLLMDAQGKALGQKLLQMPINIDEKALKTMQKT